MKMKCVFLNCSLFLAVASSVIPAVASTGGKTVRIQKDGACSMNIDGIGKDPVRNCAQDRAQSLVREACDELGGEVTTISSSNSGNCEAAGDLVSRCEATAKGLCLINEETKQAKEAREREALEADRLATQQAAQVAAQREQANQQQNKNIGIWLNYAKNLDTVCEFISKQRPYYTEQCRNLQSSVQLTESGARIAMAAAINNQYIGLDVIKAADKKEFSLVAQNLCMTIGLSNAGFSVDCIKASAGKTYTEAEGKACSSILGSDRRAIAFTIKCLETSGKL